MFARRIRCRRLWWLGGVREAAGPLRGLRTRALELSKEGSEVELGNVELCKYLQASLLGIHIPTETSNGSTREKDQCWSSDFEWDLTSSFS